MNSQDLTRLLIEYRYWILVPLAIIEGPIVALVSGTLASLGYFNLYALALFFFVRDMAMDGLYYYAGYFGSRTKFAQKMLRKIKVQHSQMEAVRTLWEEHPARTMFLGKFSYGIAQAFIVVAGTVKMNLRKFFGYGALAALAQYITLLLLGYFFGNAFGGSLSAMVQNIQYATGGAAVIILGYYIFRWRVGCNFFK
jgi:membrane protein DedA with SNARE-associated domain